MKFLEILVESRLEQQRMMEAQLRRDNNEWELGPNCPDEGLKAHAILKVLKSETFDVKTENDEIRLETLKTQLNDLERKIANDESSEYDEQMEEIKKQIDEIEEKIDVYNLYPIGSHYQMETYIVLNSPSEERTYAVGDEYEVDRSLVECVENLIDDIGYKGFRQSFVENYIDKIRIERLIREIIENDIYDEPENYLDEKNRLLSKKQVETIAFLRMKIKKMNSQIINLNNEMEEYPDENFSERIELLENNIFEAENEIDEIISSPEGGFPNNMVEEKIEEMVDEYLRDPISYMKDIGIDFESYIDKDKFIQGVIEEDDLGTLLNPYDGSYEEIYVQGKTYWVMRID